MRGKWFNVNRWCAAGAIALGATAAMCSDAHAGIIVLFSDVSGLAGEAEFTLINPTTIEIRLANTSTGVPGGFDNADQLLTGLSWDFGAPGIDSAISILGGGAVIGPTSMSMNFDTGSYGPGTDVGGEWGYGNNDGTGALPNFITSNSAQSTPFGGPNLDGPDNMDGPQGGLVANPPLVDLGGLGAIKHEIVSTITISAAMTEQELFDTLNDNGVVIEFGSDAAFLTGTVIPAPGAFALLGVAGIIGIGRNRRRR